jgi:hypothetical protein
MVTLNKFIFILEERGLPFIKLLKWQEKFAWTAEADQALLQLKDFMSKPPVLTAPRKKEQLLLYLTTTTHVVTTAIVVERQEEGHTYPVQRPTNPRPKTRRGGVATQAGSTTPGGPVRPPRPV